MGEEPGLRNHLRWEDAEWMGEGDPKYWRVEAGDIVGEITPETIVKSNKFLIWRGGEPADFELKVDFRITSGGNSGINYRSVVVPDKVTPANRYAMRGYQCDIDGQRRYTGNNYEEKGRLFVTVQVAVQSLSGAEPPAQLSEGADGGAWDHGGACVCFRCDWFPE